MYSFNLDIAEKDTKVFVKRENDHALHVTFAEPVRAITPGQAVLYQGDVCLVEQQLTMCSKMKVN